MGRRGSRGQGWGFSLWVALAILGVSVGTLPFTTLTWASPEDLPDDLADDLIDDTATPLMIADRPLRPPPRERSDQRILPSDLEPTSAFDGHRLAKDRAAHGLVIALATQPCRLTC
jgi:hypothetical protein